MTDKINHSSIPELKIAVLGKSLVGKSALTFRFINDRFPGEHDTTIEDSYTVPTQIDDISCQLEILDTAGQDDYQTMIDTWINSADGYLLVYSIDNKDSFEGVKMRYERILTIKEKLKNFSIAIVGNKCDLEEKREVTREEANKYCQELGVTFLEVSALQKINVKEAFLTVARDLLKKKYPKLYKKKGGLKRCYCF